MYTFPFVPWRYSKTASIGLIIIFLCLIPSEKISNMGVTITFADVIVHFLMFGTFSAALFLDLNRKRTVNGKWRFAMITFLISLGLGISTELLQYFIVPLNRTGSFVDLLFDVLGTAFGISAILLIRRKSVPVN